jgi:hypothetical protein
VGGENPRTPIQALIGLVPVLGAGYVFFWEPEYVIVLPIVLLLMGVWAAWYFWPMRQRYLDSIRSDEKLRIRQARYHRLIYVAIALIAAGFFLISLIFLPELHKHASLLKAFVVAGFVAVNFGGALLVYRSTLWWWDYLNNVWKR